MIINLMQVNRTKHNVPNMEDAPKSFAPWFEVISYMELQLGNAREFARYRGLLRDARIPAPNRSGLLHMAWNTASGKPWGFGLHLRTPISSFEIGVVRDTTVDGPGFPFSEPTSDAHATNWRTTEDFLRQRMRLAEEVLRTVRALSNDEPSGVRAYGMCHINDVDFRLRLVPARMSQ